MNRLRPNLVIERCKFYEKDVFKKYKINNNNITII